MDESKNLKVDGTVKDRKAVSMTVEKQFVMLLLITLFTALFIAVVEITG